MIKNKLSLFVAGISLLTAISSVAIADNTGTTSKLQLHNQYNYNVTVGSTGHSCSTTIVASGDQTCVGSNPFASGDTSEGMSCSRTYIIPKPRFAIFKNCISQAAPVARNTLNAPNANIITLYTQYFTSTSPTNANQYVISMVHTVQGSQTISRDQGPYSSMPANDGYYSGSSFNLDSLLQSYTGITSQTLSNGSG